MGCSRRRTAGRLRSCPATAVMAGESIAYSDRIREAWSTITTDYWRSETRSNRLASRWPCQATRPRNRRMPACAFVWTSRRKAASTRRPGNGSRAHRLDALNRPPSARDDRTPQSSRAREGPSHARVVRSCEALFTFASACVRERSSRLYRRNACPTLGASDREHHTRALGAHIRRSRR